MPTAYTHISLPVEEAALICDLLHWLAEAVGQPGIHDLADRFARYQGASRAAIVTPRTHTGPKGSSVQIELEFVHDKETPGTNRFTEVVTPGKTPVIGKLYLKKSEVTNVSPTTTLKVTVTVNR